MPHLYIESSSGEWKVTRLGSARSSVLRKNPGTIGGASDEALVKLGRSAAPREIAHSASASGVGSACATHALLPSGGDSS